MKLNYLFASAIVTSLLAGCVGDNTVPTQTATPKNIIFFLGDGMGKKVIELHVIISFC